MIRKLIKINNLSICINLSKLIKFKHKTEKHKTHARSSSDENLVACSRKNPSNIDWNLSLATKSTKSDRNLSCEGKKRGEL